MLSRVASWHHGSAVAPIFTPMRLRRSSRPSAVILGNTRSAIGARGSSCVSKCISSGGFTQCSRVVYAVFTQLSIRGSVGGGREGGELALAQDLAVHLAGGRLRQLADEGDLPRILVRTQPLAHEGLDFIDERVVAGATRHH